ncbi:MAG: hypothetical protein H0W61_03575 [Bacteroidetes bacterium]|nr:hypothetical protein [Bacteroidota bacterium]
MKTPIQHILLLAFTLLLTPSVNSQKSLQPGDYKNAAGIRFGGTTGVSFKHKFNPYNAMEIIAGTYPHAVGITGLYERNFLTNVDGLLFYLGAGAHISRAYYSTWSYTYNGDKDQYYYDSRNYHYRAVVGIDAIGGAEYKLNDSPVAFSLDFKPYGEFYSGYKTRWRLDPGLGIKFTF